MWVYHMLFTSMVLYINIQIAYYFWICNLIRKKNYLDVAY